MSVLRRGWSALSPLALQTITLANSTALGVNSTTRGAHVLHFSVETNDVRYRSDGTNPALTTGVLLKKDMDYWFLNYNGTSRLIFQRSTGTCKVTIQPYQYAAE
jgi:hypothetical protein